MPWYDLISTASNNQTLERARAAIGRKTKYDLGSGGMHPAKPLDRLCDCSGFVAWAIGIPRELPPGSNSWLDTDAYARGGAPAFPGLLVAVPPNQSRPGDIYVYPDYKDANGRRREGHMGIISATSATGEPTRVIHCSVSNSKAGDAVQETSPKAWTARPQSSRVMRIDYSALQARYAPGHDHPAPPAGSTATVLRHAVLAGEAVLQGIAAGNGAVLRATGGRVPGVAPVQNALNHLAARYSEYRINVGAQAQFSGYFGPQTEQSVLRFQATHRLPPDGRVGKDTIRALDAALRSFDSNNGVDRTRATPPTGEHGSGGDFRRAFIQLVAPSAQASQRSTKVPASITIAQAALESNWGRSGLTVKANNFFGIKGKGPAGSVTMDTVEWINGVRTVVKAGFRAYNSLEESIEDHARLLAFGKWKTGIPIYRSAMQHTDDPRKFAAALEGVYATDPNYAEKLWSLLDEYKLEELDIPV